jgi:1,4-dihydroxy-2-naphthoyl-CoA hydrolase
MFVHTLTVQLHQTDAYEILYFGKQFDFCNDALQAFLAANGVPFARNRTQAEYIPVVVHAEADYKAPIYVGDRLRIEYSIAHIGTTSFVNSYEIINQDDLKVGSARIVQVTIDPKSRVKIPIPEKFRAILENNRL